jgi:hypothetical protein
MSKVEDTVLQVNPDDGSADSVVGEKDGTNRDVAAMQRMGKQQLFKVLIACTFNMHLLTMFQRNFGFLSIFGCKSPPSREEIASVSDLMPYPLLPILWGFMIINQTSCHDPHEHLADPTRVRVLGLSLFGLI